MYVFYELSFRKLRYQTYEGCDLCALPGGEDCSESDSVVVAAIAGVHLTRGIQEVLDLCNKGDDHAQITFVEARTKAAANRYCFMGCN